MLGRYFAVFLGGVGSEAVFLGVARRMVCVYTHIRRAAEKRFGVHFRADFLGGCIWHSERASTPSLDLIRGGVR